MAELTMQPYAVCPHCGHVEHDSWEYDFGPASGGEGIVTCNNCGEDFHCTREVSVTYSTKLVTAKEPA